MAKEIAQAHGEAATTVFDTVYAIAKVVPNFRQKTLSAAAKIHLIVSEQRSALTPDELRELAKELGWRLKKNEITEAINVLASLHLVTVGQNA